MTANRTAAIEDIAAERRRQIEVEGWHAAHDDDPHGGGALAIAAAWYAMNAHTHDMLPSERLEITNSSHVANALFAGRHGEQSSMAWPWELKWWKPKDRRRDLVRAGALIVAEIERLDRARAK